MVALLELEPVSFCRSSSNECECSGFEESKSPIRSLANSSMLANLNRNEVSTLYEWS